MQFIILRRFSLIICFTSTLFSNITGDLRLCLIRVSFQTDDIEGTTGDGKFLLTEQGYDLPFTVEHLTDGTFKVELHGEHDFEELDKLSNG